MPEPATDANHPLAHTFPVLQGDLGPGRVLGNRYRLVAYMGSGSSARVYLAEDRSLGRRVAVKCLRAGLTGDYRFLRRFRAEAKAAAQLSHPNILAVHDWGEDTSAAYLVTEVLLGGSLRDMIARSPRLSPSQGLLVALQVGQGLGYAHGRGWVHRDVKPANLLFGKDGRLRVADFGLARALAEATWTEPEGVLVGTARYAAPEQASGRGVGGWTDVYSLALTVVEAVTGRVPLLADNALATMMLRQDHDIVEDVAELDRLGPLGPVLAVAGRADPVSRPSSPQMVELLRDAARHLPRPERLPLVEFSPPAPPVGMTMIDLREVRDDPDPTGPPAHGGHALRLTAAQLAQARRTAAEREAARRAGVAGSGGGPATGGTVSIVDPAAAGVAALTGGSGGIGAAGSSGAADRARWADLDAGFAGGQIRTRPRPMPVGLTRRPPPVSADTPGKP